MLPLIKIAASAAVGLGAWKLVRGLFAPESGDIVDCSREMAAHYATHVRLPKAQQDKLRSHREANRKRIMEGLSLKGAMRPVAFIPQGSYAMDTINRALGNEYDIDDGVVFDAAELVGGRGVSLSPLDARRLVFECITSDPLLQIQAELRPNCVRVPYAGGYHVDVAVYRRTGEKLEHAGATWHHANPRGVNEWFQKAVSSKSPDKTDGQQMRRVTRLLKGIAASRSSWVMPSGFILSALVVESYSGIADRDDAALYLCLRKIRNRLMFDRDVKHPVVDEMLSRGWRDPRMLGLRRRIDKVVTDLEPIIGKADAKADALSAWRKVFNDPSFGAGALDA